MITLAEGRFMLSRVRYKDWTFRFEPLGDGFFLQVTWVDLGENVWTGRKWYVSSHATRSEVVQTALKAVLTAEEHEAREQFKYDGSAVFGPHLDVDHLWSVSLTLDVREDRRA